MRISAIVAMTENRVIGKNNQLPWRLPADLQYFKGITWGKPILLGRKTYESIGRALPGRQNIVLTHNRDFEAKGCIVAHSVDAALLAAGNVEEIFIIGGAGLYQQLLPLAQRIYLTLIHARIEGDAYFPLINIDQWEEVARVDHVSDEQHSHAYSFIILDNKIPKLSL